MSKKMNPQPAMPGLPGQNTPGLPGQAGTAPKLDSAAPTEVRLPRPLNDDRTKPVPFGRLFAVELRKLVDTRGGRWLLIAMVALILIASAAVMLTNKDAPVRFENFATAAGVPMGFILPILGIMAVTTEWSQRSGLVTFTLEPRRLHVGFAKWLAALVMGIFGTVLAYAIGALFTLIGSTFHTGGAEWDINGWAMAGTLLAFLIAVSQGVAFGMLIQNTPGAICAYLFLPILVSIVTTFKWFEKAGPWIDPSQSSQGLYSGSMATKDWQHFATSQTLWLLLPLLFGFWRLMKREVKSA